MRRTLSWLVAGTLVAGLGGASLASSNDTFIPIQDPPEMTIGNLTEFFGSADSSRVVNRVMPSASQPTTRDGFTGNADSDEITRNVSFSDDVNDSADLNRVAPDATVATSPYYRQTVTVTTNGPTDSIERVGYCLINSADTAVMSDDTNFRWYDETDETNDIERNCGFNDENPTYDGAPENPRAVISIIYTTSNDTFRLINQAGSQHVVLDGATNQSEASWNGKTLTVSFAYKPSHALLKASTGWIVRAAAQDQPADQDNGRPGETGFDPQMAQIFWGDTNEIQEQITSDESSRSDWREVGVAYYGAIMSERGNVSYGTLRKDESRTRTDIVTGRYVANATSELYIHATEFEFTGTGGNSLDYYRGVGSPGDKEVKFECSYDGSLAGLGGSPVTVYDTAQSLKNDLPLTTDESTPVDADNINDSGMSCKLTYGGGADSAAEVYSNEVFLSIADAGDSIAP